MSDDLNTVVPEPENREDYTRLRERAPEILEASKKHPPKSDADKKLPVKDESERGPGGTGW